MAQVYERAPRDVARIAGVRATVGDKGRQIAARARANLKGHRETGKAKIRVESRSPDYLVHLVDPAAAAIEFGGIKRDGTVVQGLYILTNAAR